MSQPKIIDDPLYRLLREEQVDSFNQQRTDGSALSFRGGDFRGLDLKGWHTAGLDLRDAYFRGADLRGVDFSQANLQGASIAGAKISGCLFPADIAADEIALSLNQGTRMRTR